MCDDVIHQGLVEDQRLSRRAFGALVAATAGAAGGAGLAADAMQLPVMDHAVTVKTADGSADAAMYHPKAKGRWPAVLMWPDILGLRPVFQDMGRRLSAQGYVVLVPNPFYRSKPAPVVSGAFDFNDPAMRKTLFGYRAAIGDDGAARDAQAYLAFLDAQDETDRTRKAGVQGYCMGGELAFRTAAASPSRIGAVASFHGGNGLVTDQPNSPHLLIARTRATYLVAQARNDDAQKPQTKDALKAAFAAAGRPATVEVYPADHGWCVAGGQAYDAAQAERAWAALTRLYRTALA